jgi:hypothetical protein
MMDIGSYEFLRAGTTGYLGRKGSTMRRQSLAVIVVLAFLGALLFQSGIAAAAAADSGRVVNGAASSVWYLAEGSTAWGFYTRVTIENPNNSRLHARLTYMTRDGEVDGREPDHHQSRGCTWTDRLLDQGQVRRRRSDRCRQDDDVDELRPVTALRP